MILVVCLFVWANLSLPSTVGKTKSSSESNREILNFNKTY